MGERLSGGSVGLALLANSLATGAGLVVHLTVFGPLSAAHLNPAARWPPSNGGAVLGVWTAHLMFKEPLLQISTHLRDGAAQAFSEGVATFGLLLAILGSLRFRPEATPVTVGLYVTAAYRFTAAMSFANPAVTIARTLTDSFAGIAPGSAPAFVAAQLAGAAGGALLGRWLFRSGRAAAPRPSGARSKARGASSGWDSSARSSLQTPGRR